MASKTILAWVIIGIIFGSVIGYSIYSYQNVNTQSQIGSLQNQIDSLKTEVNMIPEYLQQINTLKNEKASLQAQLLSIETQKAILAVENTILQTQISSLQTQIILKNSEITALQTHLTELEKANAELKQSAKIEITVDFATQKTYIHYRDDKSSGSLTATQAPKTVIPVWNTLNIWDIDWFTQANVNWFKQRAYFLDQLVVMTATGGRDTGSNEYLAISDAGEVSYNFTKLDRMIDFLKETNLTPIFVIGNTPKALTLDPHNINYGEFGTDTATPKNYAVYYNYIKALVEHVVEYGGIDFVSKWTWRVYTEPDNSGWLLTKLDGYFQIYNSTAHAIRSVLPKSKLAFGNMMSRLYDQEHRAFVEKVKEEAPDVFPDQVGFSLYGFSQRDLTLQQDLRDIADWRAALDSMGKQQVEIVIEEGQILIDENGKMMWGGDSTEKGAAFEASSFTSCIGSNILRYSEWEFYASETRTPNLNVVDMFRKMEGEQIVDMKTEIISQSPEFMFNIGGLSSLALDQSTAHVLLYNLMNDRNDMRNITLNVHLINIPPGLSRRQVYLVDKTHSNFHTEWDKLSKNFTYITTDPKQNDGSRYDTTIGMLLQGGEKTFFYEWSWNTSFDVETGKNKEQPDFSLEKIEDMSWIWSTNAEITFSIQNNSVLLLELN